jgi:Mn-dependent DtxR family transcriptional regulator
MLGNRHLVENFTSHIIDIAKVIITIRNGIDMFPKTRAIASRLNVAGYNASEGVN